MIVAPRACTFVLMTVAAWRSMFDTGSASLRILGTPGAEPRKSRVRTLASPALIVLVLLAFVSMGPGAPWHDVEGADDRAFANSSEFAADIAQATVVSRAPCPSGWHAGASCDHHGFTVDTTAPSTDPTISTREWNRTGSILQGRHIGPEPGPPRA